MNKGSGHERFGGQEEKVTLKDVSSRAPVLISEARCQALRADIRRRHMPEAYGNKEYGLTTLYAFSGILGIYVAAAAFFSLPLFWPALVLSILVGIAIAIFKAAALKGWVSRCKFSKGDHYDSLEAELRAFNSAAGG
ncbi:hypothetical protein [Burkholderia gladioli]|uniref:hypothetical protein n=1 Tax=Burkholderia gladioli TaxID=28095 RepID=UPI001FC83638|nr:hypothetical protein [Burkholderia gladioli]